MPGTFCVKITHQSPRGFICKFTSLKFLVAEQDLTYIIYLVNQSITDLVLIYFFD